ncbi:PilN domain-containing protein [Sphingobium sp. H39-3-25]|uniref:PilN domain-containing protein n=1 Tax=Sphingobium TaxID=165695 RepID=UPI0023BA1BA8|nr:PilN domain-containing protein [Sphingobium arseniciresistens]
MNSKRILNADMATIGRWIASGIRWWVAELEQLLPARLRHARSDGLGHYRFADGALTPVADGKKGASTGPHPGERVAVIVSRSESLARVIERPSLNDRDLQRMASFEGDGLLPFPSGTTIIAARRVGSTADPAKMRVEIAGLPLETARRIAETIADAKVVAVRIFVENNRTAASPLDFAPAMHEAGLIARPRSATPLVWAVVACFVVLNTGLFIWKDVRSVERLEQVVQEQQPAVTVAKTITRRTGQDETLVARSLAKRRDHDAIGGLAAISEAIPQGAWLQRYVWDGTSVKITGYKPPRTDIAGELRRSGAFADVRAMNDEIQAEVPAGEPFDIGARIARR